jgi:peptidoglycan hydrolase-like protein with peptidoglycan-binding domain
MAAVFALAAGASALAAPAANAEAISPTAVIDSVTTTAVPAEHRAEMPTIASQIGGLNNLYQLQELHQLTDLAAPVTNLLMA